MFCFKFYMEQSQTREETTLLFNCGNRKNCALFSLSIFEVYRARAVYNQKIGKVILSILRSENQKKKARSELGHETARKNSVEIRILKQQEHAIKVNEQELRKTKDYKEMDDKQ